MPATFVEVFGTDMVLAALTAKEAAMMLAMDYAVERAGFMWERGAKVDADPPVDTGRYRGSIGHWDSGMWVDPSRMDDDAGPGDAVWQKTNQAGLVTLIVGTNVFYATHVEARSAVFARAIDLTIEPITQMVSEVLMTAVMAA